VAIAITPDESDDPAFIALVEQIVRRWDEDHNPDEVFLIQIKNWFDHKWLKYSGKSRVAFVSGFDNHPQVALDPVFQDRVTFPPFTPNRVVREQLWTAAKGERRHRVHRKKTWQHSAWNLQRRVTQFASSALFVWFSSGTLENQQGSLMIYHVEGESVDAWYAALRKDSANGVWKLERTKGIAMADLHCVLGVSE
jgi:hypothetical protein